MILRNMDSIKSQMDTLCEDLLENINCVFWRFKLNLILKYKNFFMAATGLEVKPEGPDTNEIVKTWIGQDIEA